MSYELVREVLEHSRTGEDRRRWTLAIIADRAPKGSRESRIDAITIGRRLGLRDTADGGRRAVQRAINGDQAQGLAGLTDLGELKVLDAGGGRGRAPTYYIPPLCPDGENGCPECRRRKGDRTTSRFSGHENGDSSHRNGDSQTLKGDSHGRNGDTATSPTPSSPRSRPRAPGARASENGSGNGFEQRQTDALRSAVESLSARAG